MSVRTATKGRPTTHYWRSRALPIAIASGLLAASCTSATPVGQGEGSSDGDDIETVVATTAPAGEVQRGGELTIGVVSETNSWYPPEAEWSFSAGSMVAGAFYESLFVRAGDGSIIPYLAADHAVPNDDATEWTVTLRPNVTFHDGSALDADALVDMSVLWDEGRFATPGEGIASTTKVDDLTVTYALHEADPAFENTLVSTTRGVAFSPTAARGFGEDAAENPVGTGPYIFRSWVRDSEIVTTRNPNYWREGQPYVDRVNFRVLVDDNSRYASLESGDIDLLTQGGVDGLQPLIDSGFLHHSYVGSGAGAILFNTLNPPMDDVRVRLAASYAIDGAEINAVTPTRLDGVWETKSQFYNQRSPWYNPEVEDVYPYFDEAEATRLLAEYQNDATRSDGKAEGDPVEFAYVCVPSPGNRLRSQLFLQSWEDVGFTVDFSEEEQGAMVTRVVGSPTQDPPFLGDYHSSCWAEGNDGDPLPLFDARFGDVANNVLNFTNYTDPDIDAQVEVLRNEFDSQARYDATAEIGMILAQTMPIYWYASGGTTLAFREGVKNVNNFVWPDGTSGDTLPNGRLMLTEVFIDGAEPIDIPTELITPPEASVTTTDVAEEPASLPVNDAILAALPGVDSLPDGVTARDPSFPAEQCPGSFPLNGLTAQTETVTSFGGGDFGPFIGAAVYEFPEGEAEQYLANYAANAAGPCVSYNTTTASGAPLSQAQLAIDGASYGDETSRYSIRGETGGFPVNTEMVLIRTGTTVTQIYWIAVGGEPDAAGLASYTDAVLASVASAG